MGGNNSASQNIEILKESASTTFFLWISYPRPIHKIQKSSRISQPKIWGLQRQVTHGWSFKPFIPIIHSPYYYYDSI